MITLVAQPARDRRHRLLLWGRRFGRCVKGPCRGGGWTCFTAALGTASLGWVAEETFGPGTFFVAGGGGPTLGVIGAAALPGGGARLSECALA